MRTVPDNRPWQPVRVAGCGLMILAFVIIVPIILFLQQKKSASVSSSSVTLPHFQLRQDPNPQIMTIVRLLIVIFDRVEFPYRCLIIWLTENNQKETS